MEQIAQSEGEVSRCNDELSDIRENQLRLKREMDGLRDELFAREEEERLLPMKRMSPRREITAKPIAKPNEPGVPERSI